MYCLNTKLTIDSFQLFHLELGIGLMVIYLPAAFHMTGDFFRRLDNFLGPSLSSLASDIGEQYSKRPSRCAGFNYANAEGRYGVFM